MQPASRSSSCSIFVAEWITGIPRSLTDLRNIGPSSCSIMRGSPRRPERPRTRSMRWPTTPPISSAPSDLYKSICWASPSGGYIAQTLVLRRPELIRRLILAGTGPRAGEPPQDPKYGEYGALTDPETGAVPTEAFLYLFFRPSETSQAAARAFWARRHVRKEDVDPPTSAQTMAAQRAALTEWRQPRGERFAALKAIKQPTLVVSGDNDIMVPTINSFTLSQNIPYAQLIIYPDAGHGALFQVPELFVAHAEMFLDA